MIDQVRLGEPGRDPPSFLCFAQTAYSAVSRAGNFGGQVELELRLLPDSQEWAKLGQSCEPGRDRTFDTELKRLLLYR